MAMPIVMLMIDKRDRTSEESITSGINDAGNSISDSNTGKTATTAKVVSR